MLYIVMLQHDTLLKKGFLLYFLCTWYKYQAHQICTHCFSSSVYKTGKIIVPT